MTAEQFAYWLQGFAEVHGEPPTAEQWQVVKDHLGTVFQKVTPDRRPAAAGPLVETNPLKWLRSAPYDGEGVRVTC